MALNWKNLFLMFFHSRSNRIELIEEIFDLKTFRTFAVWEVRREEEFSPLKNGSGPKDTAAACRRDLMLLHLRWLEKAGAQLPADIQKQVENDTKVCEISPLVSYAGEVSLMFHGETRIEGCRDCFRIWISSKKKH